MKARYLHLIVTYLGLLHRNVAAPHDQTSVLMAHSTEVSHWPSGHGVRKKFSPDIGKCGVSHRVYGDGRFCHTTIFFPHRSLGGGARQKLQVGSLVPRNVTRKQNGVIFNVVVNK